MDDDAFDSNAGVIFRIKQETFEDDLRNKPLLIIAENADGSFTIHRWLLDGVCPSHDYADARKAAARVLQLLGIGPVAPQTWPEKVCIGHIEYEQQEAD